ncbi:MAG: Tim44 domain-containing protein [Deltaproteobacteria bacterium]|nr:Tim44 domain-containing protein [Deltaproteobacteria bacterium]
MTVLVRRLLLSAIGFFAFLFASVVVFEEYAEARAGGGRSGGFRGSRSYDSPSHSAPGYANPQRQNAVPSTPQAAPMAPQAGGFMRGLGTAMLGGFLGSMLFSSLAHAGGFGGLGGSGFGLFELVLLAGLGYFLYKKFMTPAAATGYGSMPYRQTNYQAPNTFGSQAPVNAPFQATPSSDHVDYRTLSAMDPDFSSEKFLKTAQDLFFKIQGAWNKQDTTTLRSLCGNELMQMWEEEINNLRSRGQQNKMENIALRESTITEAWTESGEDFITIKLLANLLDYTVETKSNTVVSGSDSDSVQFEEYWTFSRSVGPNSWKLSAVQQA